MNIIEIGRRPVYIQPDGTEIILEKHKEFQESKNKRKIFVVHRRGRKTSMCLEETFKYLLVNPKIIGKTLAPIRKQAKEIMWDDPDMLFSILPNDAIKNINRTDLKIELKNGSIWYLDGADDPNFQRGGNVKVLHLTEVGDHKENVWNSIYEPVLTLNNGVGLFEGNPRGQNWFYRLFQNAKNRGWDSWLVPATETPIFTPEQLQDIKDNNPENVFLAEYMCAWVGSTGTVFRSIRACAVNEPQEPQYGRKYKIGIDLAKHQDYTVISTVDRHTWEQVDLDRFNKLDWNVQKDRMKQKILHFSNRETKNECEVLVECNGVGDPIYDDLLRWSGTVYTTNQITIIPFKTTNATKSMLVNNMSLISDQGLITLLKNTDLIREFEEFTYKKNAQTFIYSAPDGVGYHDDVVMSTMLSYWDLRTKYPIIEEQEYTTLIDRMAQRQQNSNDYIEKTYLL